jgi:hypothetical protein
VTPDNGPSGDRESRGLHEIVDAAGTLHGIEEPDPPYFQGAAPFWKASVNATGGVLTEKAFLSAIEAFDREPVLEPCAHLEPAPGWARRQAEAGLTEVRCPWCGTLCTLPPLWPRGPSLPDG